MLYSHTTSVAISQDSRELTEKGQTQVLIPAPTTGAARVCTRVESMTDDSLLHRICTHLGEGGSGEWNSHSVDQAGLELRDPPAFASHPLGLKACTTSTQGWGSCLSHYSFFSVPSSQYC